ncbi:MAG: hypothetical protein WCJ30_13940, partial [Deltaproteobacteria bacterium]
MPLERWVLPPAIAAAVFTMIAIVPPGGAPPRGLRVEQVEGPVDASHPLLVRAAIEDAVSTQWEVPIETVFRARGATPLRVARMRAVPYVFATVQVTRAAPFDLDVEGDGYIAHARVTPRSAPPTPVASPPAAAAHAEHGVELRVEGGAIVPEIPTTVFVHVEGAVEGDVSMS